MASQFPPAPKTDITAGLKKGVLGEADPARLVVPKGRYAQPKFECPGGTPSFIWPGGTEGVHISGSASIAEHRYIGDNKLIVDVTHRDARRISLSGMFSGSTAAHNVGQLLDVITAVQPRTGKLLTVPGVFVKVQKVAVESYDFEHQEDDRTDSFTYTINFIEFGVGAKVPKLTEVISRISLNPKGTAAPEKGKTQRVFIVHSGARTLRAVAKLVYGDANRWQDIYHKNGKVLNSLNASPAKLPTTILTLGLKLKY